MKARSDRPPSAPPRRGRSVSRRPSALAIAAPTAIPIAIALSLLLVSGSATTSRCAEPARGVEPEPDTSPAKELSPDRLYADAADLLESRPREALAAARAALERYTENIRLYDLASRAAEAAGEGDLAIWHAHHGLDLAVRRGSSRSWRLARRIDRIDPLDGRAIRAVEDHLDELYSLAGYAKRSRFWANAAALYARLEGTRLEADARRQLESLLDDPRAAAALEIADLDLPPQAPREDRRSRAIARDGDREWEKAWSVETEHYVVRTNAGPRKAVAVADALEAMNRFYRDFFDSLDVRPVAGKCEVRLYRTRDEYLDEEKVDPQIEAFFDPRENVVATFDPESIGLPFSALWTSLFHEASHQFTDRISYLLIPGWLHEGTSTYFEGSRLATGGIVHTNRIPRPRLDGLLEALRSGRPSLRDVVSYQGRVPYPRPYYGVGWGLVYFLLNYEDATGERVYVPHYRAFVASYENASRMAAYPRFVLHFVENAAQPGIETFEDFERRFRDWIDRLARIVDGGPEAAEILLERARRQRALGRLGAAADSYRWAARKRPDHAATWIELGEVLEEAGHADAAIFAYRHALEAIDRFPETVPPPPPSVETDPAVVPVPAPVPVPAGESDEMPRGDRPRSRAARARERVRARIVDLGGAIGERLARAGGPLASEVVRWADELAREGFPLFALILLDDAIHATRGHPALIEARDRIRTGSGADSRRWRRPEIDRRLEAWEASEAAEAASDTRIEISSNELEIPLYRETPHAPFRFEATVETEERPPIQAGIVFGASLESGVQMVWVDASGRLATGSPERGSASIERLGELDRALLRRFRIAVEADPDGSVRYWINDILVASRHYAPFRLEGKVGLLLRGGRAAFSDIRLLY